MLSVVLLVIGVILLVAAYKSRTSGTALVTMNQGLSFFDDFTGPSSNGTTYVDAYFTSGVTAANGVSQLTYNGADNYPGAVQIAVYTSNSRAWLTTPNVLSTWHNSLLSAQTRFHTAGSSNGSVKFFGFSDSIGDRTAETVACGIYSDSGVSDCWICYSTTPDGTPIRTLTNVKAVTGKDTYFRVIVSPASVLYFIDNALVATHSMSLSSAHALGCGWSVSSNNPLPGPTFVITDAVGVKQILSAPRTFVDPVPAQ